MFEEGTRAVDHYRTLQVTRDADPAVIERAYKALSLKFHPDTAKVSERAHATERMQRINAAYSVLRDPKLRSEYDASLPPEEGRGWDRFWEAGLLGLFMDRYTSPPR
jgi:DnaJ-class molecular chaperone